MLAVKLNLKILLPDNSYWVGRISTHVQSQSIVRMKPCGWKKGQALLTKYIMYTLF